MGCISDPVETVPAPQRLASGRDTGLRLKEMGELAGGFEYPAVNAAIARFEKRLKIDRELQQKIKKVAKESNIEI